MQARGPADTARQRQIQRAVKAATPRLHLGGRRRPDRVIRQVLRHEGADSLLGPKVAFVDEALVGRGDRVARHAKLVRQVSGRWHRCARRQAPFEDQRTQLPNNLRLKSARLPHVNGYGQLHVKSVCTCHAVQQTSSQASSRQIRRDVLERVGNVCVLLLPPPHVGDVVGRLCGHRGPGDDLGRQVLRCEAPTRGGNVAARVARLVQDLYAGLLPSWRGRQVPPRPHATQESELGQNQDAGALASNQLPTWVK